MTEGHPWDWRDGDAYVDLRLLHRRDFALEYLNRNTGFLQRKETKQINTMTLASGITILRSNDNPSLSPWGLRFRVTSSSKT
jgi:Family of unknown function (DUF6499)